MPVRCDARTSFVPAGENLAERNYGYRPLSSQELAAILKELPKRRADFKSALFRVQR